MRVGYLQIPLFRLLVNTATLSFSFINSCCSSHLFCLFFGMAKTVVFLDVYLYLQKNLIKHNQIHDKTIEMVSKANAIKSNVM